MNQSTKASSTGEKSSRYEKCQVIGATDVEYPRCENEKCELIIRFAGLIRDDRAIELIELSSINKVSLL